MRPVVVVSQLLVIVFLIVFPFFAHRLQKIWTEYTTPAITRGRFIPAPPPSAGGSQSAGKGGSVLVVSSLGPQNKACYNTDRLLKRVQYENGLVVLQYDCNRDSKPDNLVIQDRQNMMSWIRIIVESRYEADRLNVAWFRKWNHAPEDAAQESVRLNESGEPCLYNRQAALVCSERIYITRQEFEARNLNSLPPVL